MNKIKELFAALKKKPWLILVIVGVVILGVFSAMRKPAAVQGSVEEVPLASGGGSSGGSSSDINSALSDITSQLNSRLEDQNAALAEANEKITGTSNAYNALVSAFNGLTNSFNSYTTNTNSVIAETNKSLTALSEKRAEPIVDSDPLKDLQIKASQSIAKLQTQYADVKSQALSDGKIDAKEKAALDSLHKEADTIGISAGLQSGATVDGSGRKIVK